jgi:hypothetical protein
VACVTKMQGFTLLETPTRTLFSLQTATRVFEKALPLRRPTSYDTDVCEGSIRRSVVATLRQKNSRTPCL